MLTSNRYLWPESRARRLDAASQAASARAECSRFTQDLTCEVGLLQNGGVV